MGWGGWLGRILGAGRNSSGPIADTPFVVLDTELTGLDERKDDIVSIGAVRMRGGRIELGGSFHELVNPTAVLDARSVVIHGITPSQVETRPPIDEVLAAFLAYAGDAVLVGHCLPVDLAFLNREARRVTGGPLRNRTVDTLSLSAWLSATARGAPGLCGLTPWAQPLRAGAGLRDPRGGGAHGPRGRLPHGPAPPASAAPGGPGGGDAPGQPPARRGTRPGGREPLAPPGVPSPF